RRAPIPSPAIPPPLEPPPSPHAHRAKATASGAKEHPPPSAPSHIAPPKPPEPPANRAADEALPPIPAVHAPALLSHRHRCHKAKTIRFPPPRPPIRANATP